MGTESKNSHKFVARVILLFSVISLLLATTALADEPFLEMPAPPSSGSAPWFVLDVILTGLVLGAIGQTFRVFVGIKKELAAASTVGKNWKEWFNGRELGVSLLLGGVAGAVAALALTGTVVDGKFYLACLSAGYAGSDFLQSFFIRGRPPSDPNEYTDGTAGKATPNPAAATSR